MIPDTLFFYITKKGIPLLYEEEFFFSFLIHKLDSFGLWNHKCNRKRSLMKYSWSETVLFFQYCASVSLIIDMRKPDERVSLPTRRWCIDINIEAARSSEKTLYPLPQENLIPQYADWFSDEFQFSSTKDGPWFFDLLFLSFFFYFPPSFRLKPDRGTKQKEAADKPSSNNPRVLSLGRFPQTGKKDARKLKAFYIPIRSTTKKKLLSSCFWCLHRLKIETQEKKWGKKTIVETITIKKKGRKRPNIVA